MTSSDYVYMLTSCNTYRGLRRLHSQKQLGHLFFISDIIWVKKPSQFWHAYVTVSACTVTVNANIAYYHFVVSYLC